MDARRFDRLTRALTASRTSGATRRNGLRGLVIALAGMTLLPHLADAKKGKTRKKRLRRNQFGCVNVGGKCRGKNSVCCSGNCDGKKPKKGTRDKSSCIGHNEGACTPERNLCALNASGPALCNPTNTAAACLVTTGGGVFCGSFLGFTEEQNCRLCNTDGDCIAAGFPPGSACVTLTGGGIACEGTCLARTGGRSCPPPGI
jgi:hypothetical protein